MNIGKHDVGGKGCAIKNEWPTHHAQKNMDEVIEFWFVY